MQEVHKFSQPTNWRATPLAPTLFLAPLCGPTPYSLHLCLLWGRGIACFARVAERPCWWCGVVHTSCQVDVASSRVTHKKSARVQVASAKVASSPHVLFLLAKSRHVASRACQLVCSTHHHHQRAHITRTRSIAAAAACAHFFRHCIVVSLSFLLRLARIWGSSPVFSGVGLAGFHPALVHF